ncbi:hypothetical protein PoB_000949400 [Plakobranchus ocellatus]|uniref:Uncharacterized protein n=1 Tax=Plakobranchus ocellatus TaxID=259542 RepID=A0AAV3YLS2_9GAST|nr:hypothetical protein PoB_000949400 [Plakobranchus ocellatus]
MDQPPPSQQQQQQQTPQSYPLPSNSDQHLNNSSYTDPNIIRSRVNRHPKVMASKGLPGHVSVNLVCRGVPVNLELHHYYDTGSDSMEGMAMRNDMSDMLNSRTENGQDESILVFTRSGRYGHVVQDDFPRMYDSSCRTYRDYRNQAYFLLIEDPEYSSFKFLGSFVMRGQRYFVEPYASGNSSSSTQGGTTSGKQGNGAATHNPSNQHQMRAHVSTQIPFVDFNDDLGRISLPENLALLGRNVRNRETFPGYVDKNRDDPSSAHPDLVLKEYLDKIDRENLELSKLPYRRVLSPDRFQNRDSIPDSLLSERLYESVKENLASSRASASLQDPSRSRSNGRGRRNRQTNSTKQKRRRNNRRRRKRSSNIQSNQEAKQNGIDLETLLSKHKRLKRMAVDRYRVEIFIVCDYLCYLGFQREKRVTDETATKNAILQFFSLVQEALKTAYGGLETQHKDVGISIDARVVGVYIATSVDDKIIGDYVIGNSREIDTTPSIFEFALWVQDKMSVSLKADHYALVTGYDLAGDSRDVIGQVSRVPSVCDIDRVSVNEFLIK